MKSVCSITTCFIVTILIAKMPNTQGAPSFSGASTFSVSESRPIGTIVGTISAVDGTNPINYSITIGGTHFTIDSTSGIVYTARVFDSENGDIRINITVSATSSESTDQIFEINITPENDNPPVFNPNVYFVSVVENTATSTSIALLTVTDADGTTPTISIFSGNNDNKFELRASNTKEIITQTADLDYEGTTNSYVLIIHATDTAQAVTGAIITATATVIITVEPANEHTPAFSPTSITNTINENSTIGTMIANPVATDEDASPHDIAKYTINQVTQNGAVTTDAYFAINSLTGEIKLAKMLDYDTLPNGDKTYHIEVFAIDGGTPAMTGSATITVTVQDDNDVAPICSNLLYVLTVPENSATSYEVIPDLGCTDLDSSSLTYTVMPSTMTAFSVDTSASMEKLKPAGTLDYENGTTNYAFTIVVTDSVHTATISVGITISDVNEASPVFDPSSYTNNIAEDTILGASVITVTATDADTADKFVYSIISGNNDNKFVIDSDTGIIRVAGELDADSPTTYTLVVAANEVATTNSATASVTITVSDANDNTPKFTQNIYYVVVNEVDTAGPLLTLTATDGDSGTLFTYTLEASSTPATYTSYFGFDTTTVNQLNLLAPIDLDTSGVQSFYTLVVMVTDDGTPARSSTSSVLVSVNTANEHTPTLSDVTFTIAESAIYGAQVGILTALDSDRGADGEITYTVLSGNCDGRMFAVDPTSGAISVLDSLDYETVQTYALTVKAADGGSPSKTVTAVVTINVTAVSDEKCTTHSFSESITEPGVLNSQTYVQLVCSDADEATLSYVLTGNTEEIFAINSAGSITLAAALDFDGAVRLFNMSVTVTDSSNNYVIIPVFIEIKPYNEFTPVFPANKIVTFSEDEVVGIDIATHVATDGDSSDTPDGVITYSIQSVTNGGLNHFIIDPTTAKIILAKPLDYETAQAYVITVSARDGGLPSRSATALVTVNVNNVNDNTPKFAQNMYYVTINEDKTAGVLLTLTATDADAGTLFTYTLEASSTPAAYTSYFRFDTTTRNQLNLLAPIDLDTSGVQSLYTLVVMVTDNGSPARSSTSSVLVSVNSVNENTPTLGAVTFSIAESAIHGAQVGILNALDSDSGADGEITYTIIAGTGIGKFAVDPKTGAIVVLGSIDYDLLRTWWLTVRAADGGSPSKFVNAQVTITVTNVSDEKPKCMTNSFFEYITEPGVLTTTYVSLACSDADGETLSYSLSNNPGPTFAISSTGRITLAYVLDFEGQFRYFDMKVTVTDTAGNSVIIPVFIDVKPANEFSPVFPADKTVNFNENTALGSAIATHVATDGDANYSPDGVITYYIQSVSNGGLNLFSISPTTGKIILVAPFDYETARTYVITVMASDGGSPPRSATGLVTVNVHNVNDATPRCSSTSMAVTVSEDKTNGFVVIPDLQCIDAENDSLTIAIRSQSPSSGFKLVNDAAGVTSLQVSTNPLNYETAKDYFLEITATDTGGLFTTVYVAISILDVNDGPPVIQNEPYTPTVAENVAIGFSVTTVTATDPDEAGSDFGKLTYAFTSGNAKGHFVINPYTGKIMVAGVLDYETDQAYTLVVTVTEKTGGGSDTTNVVVTITNVNDNVPSCQSDMIFTTNMDETDSINKVLYDMTCSDTDGSPLTYTITTGNTHFFDADDATSNLVLKNQIDYDVVTQWQYDLHITVSDGTYSVVVKGSVIVNAVNEHTPIFTMPTNFYLAENTAVGTSIYKMTATDSDKGGHGDIRYYIRNGNTGVAFSISPFTGDIYVANVLDFDVAPTSYTLRLEAEDTASTQTDTRTGTVALVITLTNLNDHTPTCFSTSMAVTVPEDKTNGFVVIPDLQCTDAENDALTISIRSQSPSSGFQLVKNAAGVTSLQVSTNPLNYETAKDYLVEITATDPGGLFTNVIVDISILDVNEGPPVIQNEPYTPTVAENVAIGFSLTTITAKDPDEAASDFGKLTYAITSGNAKGHFVINPDSGKIVVAGVLDYEKDPTYTLVVTVTEKTGGGSDTTNVVVTITNVNDNVPSCQSDMIFTTNMAEADLINKVLYDMTCSDADGNALSYTITTGDTHFFDADDATSNLVLKNQIDYDVVTQWQYDLHITVSDGTYSVVVKGSVIVNAVNEHTPIFTMPTNFDLAESTAVGKSIYTLTATDSDKGEHGDIRYYIRNGNNGVAFSINPFTGDIYVANVLDFDVAPTSYTLRLEAEDTASTQTDTRTGTVTLVITLTDSNDHTPVFTQDLYTTTLEENVAYLTSVVTVQATDKDTGNNGAITYSVVGGTGSTWFSVHATTGVISTQATIDYEVNIAYDLIVKAVDGGTTPLSATCFVRIAINDLNDNSPKFPAAHITVEITESTPIGTSVITAVARDADSLTNNNNVVVYLLNPSSSKFKVHTSTGVITTNDLLDRESQSSHTIIVYAIDQGTSQRQNTATITYTISLIDENDNDPVIQNAPFDKTISEDTPLNTVVFTVNANDNDFDQNKALTYSILNGNTGSDFGIDPSSGLIWVVNALDRERTATYHMTLKIVDNGLTPRSATITSTVTISDKNDKNPIFRSTPYVFTISEHVPTGTLIDRVTATDADINLNGAVTFEVAYFITGKTNHITLEASSGALTTATTLDRDVMDLYVLVIRAKDGGAGSRTATATVSIKVLDYNDNAPTFSAALYEGKVLENTVAGTSILTVVIDDLDIDNNANITLSISDTNANMYIAADSTTYVLFVKTPIDREVFTHFEFVLTATDDGTPQLTATTTVRITVIDVNDNEPQFSPTFYSGEIAYNDDCQVTITTLTANDADEGVNADLTFAFTQNENPELFSLNANTGAVSLIATASANTKYKVNAAATDAGSPSKTSTTEASVRIDVYDPTSIVLNYYMSIPKVNFLTMKSTFLAQLTTVFRQTHATSEAKICCVTEETSTSCIVRLYVLKDDTADTLAEIDNAKNFLTSDEVYAIAAKDTIGTPTDDIKGSIWTAFSITKVEKNYDPVPPTPWIETAPGIVTIVVTTLLFMLIGAVVGVVLYKMRRRPALSP